MTRLGEARTRGFVVGGIGAFGLFDSYYHLCEAMQRPYIAVRRIRHGHCEVELEMTPAGRRLDDAAQAEVGRLLRAHNDTAGERRAQVPLGPLWCSADRIVADEAERVAAELVKLVGVRVREVA